MQHVQDNKVRAAQGNAASAEAACKEGAAAFAAGNAAEAERLAKQALTIAPDHLAALKLLRQCTKRRSGPDYEELLRRILRQTTDLEGLFELSDLLFARGAHEECSKYVRAAVAAAPESPQAQWNMAILLTANARHEAAEIHFRRLIALVGERPRNCAHLAECLKRQGKFDESEAWYRKVTKLEPDNVDAWLDWCLLVRERGDIPRAWPLLREAARRAGEVPQVRLMRARLLRAEGKFAEAIDLLSDKGGEILHYANLFERGECLKALGRFDEAWADFAEAKRQCREEGHRYDAAKASSEAQKLKEFFVRGRVSSLARAESRTDVPQPLFITGFPRSGTTLVEQILTSHPLVRAGDELRYVNFVTRLCSKWLDSHAAYPECLGELSIGDNLFFANHLRDYYLDCARAAGLLGGADAAFFTDKMPLNEMHLGLIHLLFPASPVVYLRRHPLDIVCSNFESFHVHGFGQAFAVETVAQHYVLLDGLLAHYREQLDLKFLEVRYEDLVADQEAEVRRLLAFAGLEFDPRCLSFHENPRIPRTGSYAQVAKKLYGSSVHRYRHYLRHLGPAIEILRPTLERLGYPWD